MCGITGQLLFGAGQQADRGLIEAMVQRLRHRGPDAAGVWQQGPVGLGQARLSIIDLSPAGHQPMFNEDGTVVLVFNGEIYNFQQLRRQLTDRGHEFRSGTDSEVIIHLWEEHGPDCVQQLRGMFAFALWDQSRQQLFLARDRIGKKPLKYHLTRQGITFASELKALLEDPQVPREPDLGAISDYLTYQYVPAPQTGFRGIAKLPPAHWMLVSADGQVETRRWWELSYEPVLRAQEGELQEEFGRIFEESVRLRMIADVPLGAFLSGGVDSSAVVWAMSRLSDRPVRTFSIGFQEAAYDETGWARQIASLCGTEHQEFTVRPDALELLPRLIEQYEEPYADSSALPTWYLCELTRRHVTVALNGDGGDESFAGYRRHRYWRLAQSLPGGRWFPGVGGLAGALDWAGCHVPVAAARWINAAATGLHNLAQTRAGRYPDMWAYFPEHLKNRLLTSEFREQSGERNSYRWLTESLERHPREPAINRVLATDVRTYLPDDLLVKVDIAAMAHGLECRSPLLDQELMEFAARLPVRMKVGLGSGKLFLRKWLRGKIPDEILDRPKKGFGVPLDAWFQGELRGLAKEILLDRRTLGRGWFRPAAMEQLLREHATGRRQHGKRIWALIMLELWMRRFVDV